ncbi:alpha-1 2-mannosidase [Ligilactobacillus salitolerans]|uniref:Alpha-1 2-mannosidase n=1 Tax=Ligilactobacillus salitolerans TaxID=1808352 RepID=A0A401ISN6_9LACO|nr:GH92 family glycosyl hydrolase [Ligilactobacillus salitolerans]GBG94536.1 alpha-1 2-mannosidase [Ligilactobacillus salitolerans]
MQNFKRWRALLTLVGASALFGLAANLDQAHADQTLFSTSFEADEDQTFPENEVNDRLGSSKVENTFDSIIPGDLTNQVEPDSIKGSKDFNDNETKQKLFDSDLSTKFLSNENDGKDIWVSFSLPKAQKIGIYAISSANDEASRDPKDWQLYGSTDGKEWESIDKQTDQKFSGRKQWQKYQVQPKQAYRYYKLQVEKNNGANMTQLSELKIGTNNKADDPAAQPMMSSTLSTGPKDALNQQNNLGWTGKKALEFKGKVSASGNAYSHNNLIDDLNIKVKPDTKLQYKIFPSDGQHDYDNKYDYQYTPMYVAINLEFTDGTFLSQLKPQSTDSFEVTPSGQGSSRSLYYNQWNQITTNIGQVAAGKTIKRVLVSFNKPDAQAGKTFDDFIDDVKLANGSTGTTTAKNKTDYVNTLRGTNATGDFSRGLNVPATTVPNGFNFWAPATNYNSNVLYEYQNNGDRKFQYMTVSHEPSIWVGDRGTWQFMVNTSIDSSKVTSGQDIDHNKYASTFDHADETAKPQLYSIKFPAKSNAAGATMSLTPSMHGAIARFQFDPDVKNKNVVFDSARGNGSLEFAQDGKSFTAITQHGDNGMHQMYVYGQFDKPVQSSKVENSKQGIVSFKDNDVSMKVATSFVSAKQAQKNYELELAQESFASLQQKTTDQWEQIMNKIQVKGATHNQLVTLYSNMYRLYMYPNFYGENQGTAAKPDWVHSDPYSGSMSQPVVKPGKMYYNNGFWDTYRTAWSAYSLLSPAKESEYLDGLVQHYRDQGWVPRWIAPGGTNSMVGTSSDIIFADAMMKGIPFDQQDAYQSAIKNASVRSDNLTNGGRKALNQSAFLGYVPLEKDNFGLSWSLEGYINDWGIYQMAKKQHRFAEAEYYKNRALTYVKMFDGSGKTATDKWLKGKKTDGSWSTTASSFDPRSWSRDYTETDAYNMAVSVPQDGNGLANLYGGPTALAQKIDQILTTPGDFTTDGGVIHEMREQREVKLGQYGHSNQPAHNILYMYAFSSQPWKTQKYVRDVLQRLYVGSDFGQGYVGDEDNGEQSAWYILSALGIYPQNLGSNQFVLGSPLFKEAKVQLPNGKSLTVQAPNNSQQNVYVDSVYLNGRKINNLYLDYKQLMHGGTLRFNMSARPNKFRGTQAWQKPESLTKGKKTPTVKTDAFDQGKVTSNLSDGKNLTDNNSETAANVKDGSTLDVTLDQARRLDLLTLSNEDQNTKFKSVELKGSRDGKHWYKVDKINHVDFTYAKSTKPFLLKKNFHAYKHYRLEFKGGSGKIGEVELLGKMGEK